MACHKENEQRKPYISSTHKIYIIVVKVNHFESETLCVGLTNAYEWLLPFYLAGDQMFGLNGSGDLLLVWLMDQVTCFCLVNGSGDLLLFVQRSGDLVQGPAAYIPRKTQLRAIDFCS